MTTAKSQKTNRMGRLFNQLQKQLEKHSEHRKDKTRYEDLFDTSDLDDEGYEASGIDSNERMMLNVLKFCLLAGMGYFILGNVRPYIGFSDSLLFQWKDTQIFLYLLKLPVIGWLLGGGFALVGFVIGTILWAILQLAELLPTFLNDSADFILAILGRIKSWQKLKTSNKDSRIAQQLKQRYNTIPESTLEKANVARAVAYLLDGVICLTFYKPIEGGWGNLQTLLLTNDWSYFKADQFGFILVTLFAVEVLYWGYKLVTGIIELYFQNN